MIDPHEALRHLVLVLTLSELTLDARVLRQIGFLTPDYDVVVAAPGADPGIEGTEFIELPQSRPRPARRRVEGAARAALRACRLHGAAYSLDARVRRWKARLARALPVDAIVVNDPAGLPLARSVDRTVPVVYDAHEHWTSESSSWTWRQRLSMRSAHDWLVDRHVPHVAGMMTVSPAIADDFARRTGLRPELVTNAPHFQPLSPSEVSEPMRLVHVGVADERRRLEDTIDAVRSLEGRFTLDMVLARDNEHRRRLDRLSASTPHINVLRPVPRRELIAFCNRYDVGIHFLPAAHFNHIHALPNKLFDYIQARLAVAVGPSPAMAEVLQDWDCGVVSRSFRPEALADLLGGLSVVDVERMKQNADRAARVLTAENNRDTVVSLVARAIGDAPPRRS